MTGSRLLRSARDGASGLGGWARARLRGVEPRLGRAAAFGRAAAGRIGIKFRAIGALAAFQRFGLPKASGRGRGALLAAVAALALAPFLYLAYALATLPSAGGMSPDPSPSALTVQAAGGEAFATRGVIRGEPIASDAIPPNLRAAIVAIEDRRFYSHHGLDMRALGRAVMRNFGGGREGASTITQQLARLTYLSQERSLRRKVQEAALALWLDATLSKDEILARYLNRAYFGAGAWGADAAARRYFGKPARELDLGEGAMLAGLVRSPSSLAPNKNLDGARARAELVLAAVAETGSASPEAIEAARRNPASVWTPPGAPPGTGYALDMVEAEVRRLPAAAEADLTVTSTLDRRLQAAAERALGKALAEEGPRRNVSQAALVAMAGDGAILALVGGRDYGQSQFNRAVQAKRQPGSLFKLFVYLAALEKGATPQSMAVDRPVQIGEWEPDNYGGRYRGPVTLRTAFAQSINTVAVQLADAVGIETVAETARSLGIASDLPKLPSLALGSAEVTLLEMVRAFGTLASGRESVEPYLVRKVSRGEAAVFERAPADPKRRDDQARADMLELLLASVQEGTGKAARLPGIPVGGKTGTTQESRDAWFVGFMPGLTIGIWVGNDDNSPTRGVTGGDLPARLWRAVATEAVRLRIAPAIPEGRAAVTGSLAGPERAAEPPRAGLLRGRASVRDTGAIEIGGREIRLAGIEGIGGRAARDFSRYLRRREVVCEPEGEPVQAYRCSADGQDLARVILYNGGGRAGAGASEDLREAEAEARAAGIGIWGR